MFINTFHGGLSSLLSNIGLVKKILPKNSLPEIEILVTAGATQAIFTTIQALVKANDEVIILDPSYDCYEAPILLCNAIPVRISLNDDYTTNWVSSKMLVPLLLR
jgi:methionine aminotransferase